MPFKRVMQQAMQDLKEDRLRGWDQHLAGGVVTNLGKESVLYRRPFRHHRGSVLLNFVFKHTINEKWSKQGTETKQLQGSLIG